MGGETEANVSGWTVDTLRQSVQHVIDERDRRYGERFEAQEKAVTAALMAAKEAVLKAEAASERRFESVNEFRQTLSDQARDLMPRLESEQRLATLTRELATLTERVNKSTNRVEDQDRRQQINFLIPAIIFGAIGSLLGIAGFIYAVVR